MVLYRKYDKNFGVVFEKRIPQSELTAECWLIQFRGLEECEECDFLNMEECGGKNIRKRLLK